VDTSSLASAEAFVTRDGSTIRELFGPATVAARNQSLAEATLAPGQSTERHYHRRAEEIYFIVSGAGRMELDGETAAVVPGDAILIRPGAWHQITATGEDELRLLCCCAPPYSHEDTFFA
jgi:mannose-6-phosphate isomerase-like protein (cupin superfamily)